MNLLLAVGAKLRVSELEQRMLNCTAKARSVVLQLHRLCYEQKHRACIFYDFIRRNPRDSELTANKKYERYNDGTRNAPGSREEHSRC